VENGKIVLDGMAEKLRNDEDIEAFYLGLSQVCEKKSCKESNITAGASGGWDSGRRRAPIKKGKGDEF